MHLSEKLFEDPVARGLAAPRVGRGRLVVMPVLLGALLTVIGGYLYITDSARVRVMAESYLSGVTGTEVKVRRARLSIFEGLRLDGVTVQTEASGRWDEHPIFSADTVLVRTDPAALLRGRLDARQIIAINAQLWLIEDLASGTWNYSGLLSGRDSDVHLPRFELSEMSAVRDAPEILLRNARVNYSELRDEVEVFRSWMAVEARVGPDAQPGVYTFNIQSRGASEGAWAGAGGSFDTATAQFLGQGRDIDFGQDFRSMSPAEMRRWFDERGFSGTMDVPSIAYRPAINGEGAEFRVETRLKGVQLTLDSAQWRSREERQRLEALQAGLEWMRWAGLNAGGRADDLGQVFDQPPIQLDEVEGDVVFMQDGIEIRELICRVEGKRFRATGVIHGYSPDAAAEMTISSVGPDHLVVPESPAYVTALPTPVRTLYYELSPQGRCAVEINIRRSAAGGRIEVNGEINIIDGQFVFDEFPYPVRQATGRILIESDPERVVLVGLRGRGLAGGPNADAEVTVDGWIGPFAPGSGVQLRIEGRDLQSEPALHAAFPAEAREALRMFRGLEDIQAGEVAPVYRGDFVCVVDREIGLEHRLAIHVDIDLKDGRGVLADFPYPLEGLSGRILIRPDHVALERMRMRRGDADLALEGRVSFGGGAPVTPELFLRATGVAVDEVLLEALPEGQRRMVERLGPGGRIDVAGRIFRDNADVADGSVEEQSRGFEPAFDLSIRVHDGVIAPQDSEMRVEQVSGRMRLTRRELQMHGLTGVRNGAVLGLRGRINWMEEAGLFDLRATGRELVLDEQLYAFLPAGAQRGWEQVQPEGAVDFELRWRGGLGDSEGEAAAAEAGGAAGFPEQLDLTIRPRGLTATLKALPYRLEDMSGSIRIRGERIDLVDVAGRHGQGTIRISGEGETGPAAAWRLRLSGEEVVVDEVLLEALPEALSGLLEGMKVEGPIGFDFTRLDYRERPVAAGDGKEDDAAERPLGTDADIDFEVVVSAEGTNVELGVGLQDVAGELHLSGSVRGGSLSTLDGRLNLPALRMSDRPTRNVRARLSKPEDMPVLRVEDIHGELAGGEFGGQVALVFPEQGPSHYALSFVLRNADIREMAGELEQDVRGQLNASLALEGSWDDPASRRGRGDVLVSGRQMYRIPVLVGLVQIADLSLPLTSPFNAATARYSVDGQRVTFEQIELRSSAMLMQGSGHIDFEQGTVRMRFITDNPRALKVPFVHEFLQGVRQELLQITIHGSVEQPRVGARAFSTVQTTVDEVFRGNGRSD